MTAEGSGSGSGSDSVMDFQDPAAYFDKGLALVIADLLSIITVLSCLVCKVPQIQTVRATKSAKGISMFGLCLELFSYTVMMSYNYTNAYPLLSYFEYPILLIQEYVLVYQVLKYKQLLNRRVQLISLIYAIVAWLIYMKLFPLFILTLLVPFCTPIGATSKVLQLVSILRSKDSSAVSVTTWALSAFTNMTRIYTVSVQSMDMMLLSNFIISTFLSASVCAAAHFYKKEPKTHSKRKQKQKD